MHNAHNQQHLIKVMHMKVQFIKEPTEVKAEFIHKGMSISKWAREHGFNRGTVHQVLNGRIKGSIGESHKIAVMLGIKDGEIV
jgi:gp16 family phage-associated protein